VAGQSLAHDLNTHRNFYRQQESTIEIAKVSRLLLATEDGLPSDMRSKSFDEIELDGKTTHCMFPAC